MSKAILFGYSIDSKVSRCLASCDSKEGVKVFSPWLLLIQICPTPPTLYYNITGYICNIRPFYCGQDSFFSKSQHHTKMHWA
jgi:hypothetical protein